MKDFATRTVMASPQSKPVIIAHRGYSAKAPENTLAAFIAAERAGCTWVELDIQLSADQEIIVLHDTSLGRTSDGSGAAKRCSLAELRHLDAGSWFSEEFRGEGIPTLENVFETLDPSTNIDIEIKPAAGGVSRDVLAARLSSLCERYNRKLNVMITSFSTDVLSNVHAHAPDLPLGVLQNRNISIRSLLKTMKRLEAKWYARNVVGVSAGLVQTLQDEGVSVGVFTANSIRSVRHAIGCGVDYIITDDPVWAKTYLEGITSGRQSRS